jgi:hypothetical protein
MSILSWFLKPKKEMAKENTKAVRIWKYKVTSHAQNRTVQKNRVIRKIDMVDNLLTKPNGITKVHYDNSGPSYLRIGTRVTTAINPKNNKVTTVRPVSRKDRKEFNLVKVGNKNIKRKKVNKNAKKSK